MGSFSPWTVISHFTSFLVYCGGCFDVLCLTGPVCPSLGNLVATLEGPPPDVRLCANQIGIAQYRPVPLRLAMAEALFPGEHCTQACITSARVLSLEKPG